MNLFDTLAQVAAGLAALGFFWKVGQLGYRRLKKLDEMYHELMQMPAHRAEMTVFKDQTLHELNYNSGSSLKDMVRDTKTAIEDHISNADAHNPTPDTNLN